MLGKDVQNQGRPVNDLDLDDVFQGAPLGGRQFGVDHDGVRAGGHHDVLQFLGLAGTEERARVRLGAALDDPVEDLRAGRFREGSEFAQRVLGVGECAFAPKACKHDALQAQLPVFDLGDVFEFGGQAGGAAQGVPFLKVLLVAVVGAEVLGPVGNGLGFPERQLGLGRSGGSGPRRGVLGEDPVDDSLDFRRAHVLGC